MADTAKVEANKALVAGFVRRVLGEHDVGAVKDCMSSDVEWHGGIFGTVKGAEGLAATFGAVFAALPDLEAITHDTVADEEMVVVRLVVQATHQGNLFGIAPTGKRVRWDAVDLYRISDGKIVEDWAGDDFAALLYQLGVFTPPWLAQSAAA
jgi:predicted ester cyclase